MAALCQASHVLTPQQRAEKQETFGRLHEYYQSNGVGCLNAVSKASGVSRDVLHGILQANSYPYATWKKVKRGLDKLSSATKH